MASGSPALDKAVATAHATFQEHNPKSLRWHRSAAVHMPGGNTRTVLYAAPYPVAIKSGAGNTLTSVDGRTYVDFLGEFSAGLFGHSHPRIAQALQDALAGGWNYGGESLVEKRLAAMVTGRFWPAGVELVRFTNSGTEANTFALGAAVAFTGRHKVLVFSSAYHGSTFVFPMPLCRWLHGGGGVDEAPVRSMNLPHEFVAAPFNNIAETAAIVDALPPESLAAILVEPVQGSGGCRPATPEFLRYLRATADRLGALFVVDEVMTSRLGPSGALVALSGDDDLQADLMTFGKWMGGGMTFGAFGGRREVMSLFNPALGAAQRLVHPGTYNNNVFTMNAGIAALEIYDADAVADLNARGRRLKDGITAALFDAGLYPKEHAAYLTDVVEVDSFVDDTKLYIGPETPPLPLPPVFLASRGSMLNLRFSGPDAGHWHNLYYHFMLERGIYMASRGFTPLNLVIRDEDVDMFIAAVRDFLEIYKQIVQG
ncbi:aminotransferase class 3 [Niveomyces insectorum RCEF 264]|uniref:Aminotransferase class 3 n=1 Tax=Niveomyces insectorum RCEF 264 TaxID=1081102 RepID=A0A167MFJ1_9HYPO|nr:aminotransferase class 3 [Niveomyces insectorum RCEF 264]